jgi:hypothetical protein
MNLINNFKITIVLLTAVFIGLISFSSCEKESDNNNSSISENRSVNLSKQDKVDYFNKLGIKHNEVLAFVGRNLDVSRATQEERFNSASEYLNDESTTFEDFVKLYPIVDEILENPQTTADLFFTNPENPSNLEDYYNQLGEIFATCLQNTEKSIEVTPKEFNQLINKLEESVYDNYDVEVNIDENTGDEAALFLGACAISRYSYQFWNNAVHDKNNPWFDFFNNEQSRRPGGFWGKLWHAVKVGVSDAAGFVVGGVGPTYSNGNWGIKLDLSAGVTLGGKWSSSVPKPE